MSGALDRRTAAAASLEGAARRHHAGIGHRPGYSAEFDDEPYAALMANLRDR